MLSPQWSFCSRKAWEWGENEEGSHCSLGHCSARSPLRSVFPLSLARGHHPWACLGSRISRQITQPSVSQVLPPSEGLQGPISLLWESTAGFLSIYSSCPDCGKLQSRGNMSPFIFLQETCSLTTNSLISPKSLRVWENNNKKARTTRWKDNPQKT